LILVFLAMVLLANVVFAGGSENYNSLRSSQTQGQGQGQTLIYAPEDNSKTNVIGSFPNATSVEVNAPQIPLDVQLLINQWNEASFTEVFSSFPSEITDSVIRTVISERQIQSEKEKVMSYEKTRKEILRDKIVFYKYGRTTKVMPMPSLRPDMKEGIDYVIVTRLNFVAKDKKVSKDWIGVALCEAAMELGGDVLIPTGEGAERLFSNKATLAGFIASLASVGASSASKFAGFNISPEFAITGGQNSIKVYPFLRVKVVKILNWEKMIGPPPVTPLEKVAPPDDRITRCTLPGPPNVNLRIEEADKRISGYKKTESVEDLRLARDTLWIAIDRDRAKGEQLRKIHEMLSSVNLELARTAKSEQEREHYTRRAIESAQKAGIKSIQTIE